MKIKKTFIILLILINISLFFLLTFPLIQSEKQVARNVFSSCGTGINETTCYADKLGKLTRQRGLEFSMKTFEEMQALDSTFIDCHLIAHTMAGEATRKNPSNWVNLLKSQDPDLCLGGFLHGVIEVHFLATGEDVTKETVEKTCNIFVGDRKKTENCTHMMGHVLFSFSKDMKKSLLVCDKISLFLYPFNCYRGVFMERITGITESSHARLPEAKKITPADRDEIEPLCKSLIREDAVSACWGELGKVYMEMSKYDLDTVAQFCNNIKNKEGTQSCMIHSIAEWMLIKKDLDADLLSSTCQRYAREIDFSYCIHQVSTLLLAIRPKDLFLVTNLCDAIPSQNRDGCFANLQKSISADQWRSICLKLSVENRKHCK